jgi:predicted amidohydrolase
MSNIRLAGAQIPCTLSISENVTHLKCAIDWAAKNSVDYLLTPEGSLSGYHPGYDNDIDALVAAEKKIVSYAVKNKVGLCLGTMWCEKDSRFHEGYRRENQIRFYTSLGAFLGSTNKTYTIPEYDQTVVSESINIIDMPAGLRASGLVCNDFWGGSIEGGSLPVHVKEKLGANLIFHATNGFKGELPVYDEITEIWHEGNLRMASFITGIPIVTVDNCYKMNGEVFEGKTSSQSGILLNGQWKIKAPRVGTHYFYYDFDLISLSTLRLYKHPDQDIINNNPNIKGASV